MKAPIITEDDDDEFQGFDILCMKITFCSRMS